MFVLGNLHSEISANITILVVAALVLAGMTLILVLILGGRIRPGLIHEFNRKKRRKPAKKQNYIHPDTFDPQGKTLGWKNRLHRTDRRSSQKSYAYLIPLEEQLFDFSVRLIALANKEVTIGSDPEQANIVINHASIEPCHARIRHNINGLVELYDLKSVAGCWLNYIPIGEEGGILHEGDYVHIGGIGFRFTLKQARRLPKPTIYLLPPKNHQY